MEFVNGKDYPHIFIMEKKHVWNHQPAMHLVKMATFSCGPPRSTLIALAKTPLASSTQLKSIRTNSIQQKMKQKLVKIN